MGFGLNYLDEMERDARAGEGGGGLLGKSPSDPQSAPQAGGGGGLFSRSPSDPQPAEGGGGLQGVVRGVQDLRQEIGAKVADAVVPREGRGLFGARPEDEDGFWGTIWQGVRSRFTQMNELQEDALDERRRDREVQDALAGKPDMTFDEYQRAGGKAGAGAFGKARRNLEEENRSATENRLGRRALEQEEHFNTAFGPALATKFDPQYLPGVVGYVNTWLKDSFLGGKELDKDKARKLEDGSFEFAWKDGGDPLRMSQDQVIGAVMSREFVNQKRAAQLRKWKEEDFVEEAARLAGRGYDTEKARLMAYRNVYGYEMSKGPAPTPPQLRETDKGFAWLEPGKAPQMVEGVRPPAGKPDFSLVEKGDGGRMWVPRGGTRGVDIAGTAPESKQPSLADKRGTMEMIEGLYLGKRDMDAVRSLTIAGDYEGAREMLARSVFGVLEPKVAAGAATAAEREHLDAYRKLFDDRLARTVPRPRAPGSDGPPVAGARQGADGGWYIQKEDGRWYPVVRR